MTPTDLTTHTSLHRLARDKMSDHNEIMQVIRDLVKLNRSRKCWKNGDITNELENANNNNNTVLQHAYCIKWQ